MAETTDAAMEISGVRISPDTSSPHRITCWVPSEKHREISAVCRAAVICSGVSAPFRFACSATVRYNAPVST